MKLVTVCALLGVASAEVGTPCENDNRWAPDFACDMQTECCGIAYPMTVKKGNTAGNAKKVCNKVDSVVFTENNLQASYYFYCGMGGHPYTMTTGAKSLAATVTALAASYLLA